MCWDGDGDGDGKIKAALPLVDLLWSVSVLRRAAGKGVVPLFRKIQWNQCQLRHPSQFWRFWRGEGGAAREKLGRLARVCGWDN